MALSNVRLWLSFWSAWVGYACTYLIRKPIGVIKSEYGAAKGLSNFQLGSLDLALLLPYAFVQMLFGSVGDRLGARLTLSIALLGAGISTIGFAFHQSYAALIVMLLLSGAFQSFCWPACNTGIAAWETTDIKRRQHLLGYFGTSPFAGGILGTLFAAFLQRKLGWSWTFFWPSLITAGWALVVFVLFRTPTVTARTNTSEVVRRKRIWAVKGAIPTALAVACLKVVRYGLYFWLPIQLEKKLGYTTTQAANYSAMFDVGAAIGCLVSGHVLTHLFRSNALIGSAVQTALSAVALGLFIVVANQGINVLVLITIALIGALNGAPDVILCGSVPAELVANNGDEHEIDDKPAARPVSAMIGFINGLGSLGGVIEGPLIGFIADHFGWNGVSVSMIAFSVAGAGFCVLANRSTQQKRTST